MKKSKFTEQQLAFALHQAETGTKARQVVRKIAANSASSDSEPRSGNSSLTQHRKA